MGGVRVHRTALQCTRIHRFRGSRFSTQISTQKGSAAESKCHISWSQPPTRVADQNVSPAFQAGHAGSIPVARSASLIFEVYSADCHVGRLLVCSDVYSDVFPARTSAPTHRRQRDHGGGPSGPAVPLLTGRTTVETDHGERHLTLRQTAGKQSLTRHCPARLDISPRSARVYCLVVTNRLLQTPAAQKSLAWGELSEQSW